MDQVLARDDRWAKGYALSQALQVGYSQSRLCRQRDVHEEPDGKQRRREEILNISFDIGNVFVDCWFGFNANLVRVAATFKFVGRRRSGPRARIACRRASRGC